MLTKSATLMPAADLPPSEARGHYHAGLLTKSATLMPAADLPPSEARGRYRGLLTKSKRAGTRQKRKSKTWRVRSHSQQGTGTRQKRKSKIWRVRSPPNRAQAHARKEKARLDVCGAITDAFPQITR